MNENVNLERARVHIVEELIASEKSLRHQEKEHPMMPGVKTHITLVAFAAITLFNLFGAKAADVSPVGEKQRPSLELAEEIPGALKLAPLFSDHVVLQREMPVPVWGTAKPGEKITVTFRDQKVSAVAGGNGEWRVKLAPMPVVKEPQDLTVAGDTTVVVKDVLVGEVWFGSGQSNMENSQPVGEDRPLIRYELQGKWIVAGGKGQTRGILGNFGKILHEELGVPVGLYCRAIGGSPVAGLLKSHESLAPFAVRGVLWDQGESGPHKGYDKAVGDLIALWRKDWDNPDLPVICVQKPSGGGATCDLDDPWLKAEVNGRAALPVPLPAQVPAFFPNYENAFQDMPMAYFGLARIPRVYVASSLELGAGTHPGNREGYARRSARVALAKVYGRKDRLPIGPVYRNHRVDQGRVTVTFDEVGEGLRLAGPTTVNGFAVCGADRVYVWAQGKITGKDTVELWSEKVPEPVGIRYGWAMSRPWANLFNSGGLPALSFRTDDWEVKGSINGVWAKGQPIQSEADEALTLSWDVRGANKVRIDPLNTPVEPKGTMKVTPTKTTVYRLIAEDSGGLEAVWCAVVPSKIAPQPAPTNLVTGLRWKSYSFTENVAEAVKGVPLNEELQSVASRWWVFTGPAATVIYDGWLKVAAPGRYTFLKRDSNDEYSIELAGVSVLPSDGKVGAADLESGMYPVRIVVFKREVGRLVTGPSWQRSGEARALAMPFDQFFMSKESH